MPKPTPAQRRVLEAMTDGAQLVYHKLLRQWRLGNGEEWLIVRADVARRLRAERWVGAAELDTEWVLKIPFVLTPAGRAALEEKG